LGKVGKGYELAKFERDFLVSAGISEPEQKLKSPIIDFVLTETAQVKLDVLD